MAHRETESPVALRTPRRILLLSHHTDSRLIETLHVAHYEVALYHDLPQAIQAYTERDYPVILLEITRDPQHLQFLHQLHGAPHSLAIALTGCSACQSAIDSLKAGARDYLTWPGNPEELLLSIEKAFNDIARKRFKEDMLSMLTHDLKIPLASIIGYSTLLYDAPQAPDAATALPAHIHQHARIIHACALKIQSLLDNFLTGCKVDSGRLQLSLDHVSLPVFLQDLIDTFQVELDRHHHSIIAEIAPDLPPVEADEPLLFRAVANLISNASKFSPPGSEILVQCYPTSLPHNQQPAIRIAITNPGPGLPPDDILELFERFRRGHAHHSIEGSGLGTYVVKSIAEAHGGTVNSKSEPNGLTTFDIILPIQVR